MKEERIKDALEKAAASEPATGESYARFLLTRRRMSRIRNLVIGVATIAAMSSIVMVLPGGPWNSDPPAGYTGPGQIDPTRSLVSVYQDHVAGFSVQYPLDWRAAGAPGEVVRFYPPTTKVPRPGVVSEIESHQAECVEECSPAEPAMRVEDPRGFFVEVLPIRPPCSPSGRWPCFSLSRPDQQYLNQLRLAGARVNASRSSLGGRDAYRAALAFGDEPRRFDSRRAWEATAAPTDRVLPVYWCTGCLTSEYVVQWHRKWTLDVRIVAPDARALERFGSEAAEILSTLRRYTGPAPKK